MSRAGAAHAGSPEPQPPLLRAQQPHRRVHLEPDFPALPQNGSRFVPLAPSGVVTSSGVPTPAAFAFWLRGTDLANGLCAASAGRAAARVSSSSGLNSLAAIAHCTERGERWEGSWPQEEGCGDGAGSSAGAAGKVALWGAVGVSACRAGSCSHSQGVSHSPRSERRGCRAAVPGALPPPCDGCWAGACRQSQGGHVRTGSRGRCMPAGPRWRWARCGLWGAGPGVGAGLAAPAPLTRVQSLWHFVMIFPVSNNNPSPPVLPEEKITHKLT